MKLSENKCEACQVGAPLVTDNEMTEYLKQLSGWEVITESGINQLFKGFKFSNYQDAIDFSLKVAELAEKENHHPKITLEWGKVEIFWWTHAINGLHANDFICAAKTDLI